MKKLFSSIIISTLCFAGISFAATGNNSFSDIPESHQYYDAVEWVKENGIVKGYDDGEYKPDNTISRAEFVKMLLVSKYAVWAIDESGNGKGFHDVLYSDWFSRYVLFAQEKDIIEGYSDGTFGPQKTINFAEASKIISLLHLGFDGDMSECNDSWWCHYVIIFNDYNLPTFSGDHLITRGEMANILYQIYNDGNDRFPENNTVREDELEKILRGLQAPEDSDQFSLGKYSIVKFVENINNKDFYTASLSSMGLAPNSLIYFYDNNENIEIIGVYNEDSGFYDNGYNQEEVNKYIAEHNISFGATLPEKYKIPKNIYIEVEVEGNQKTSVVFRNHNRFTLTPYLLKTGIFHPQYGEIFTNSKNALVVRTNDFVSHEFAIDIPILEDKQLAQISWDNNIDSGKYDEEWRKGYTYQTQGGCGAEDYASVISSEKAVEKWNYDGNDIFINPDTEFEKTGTGENNEKIYEFKDSQHIFLKNMYENKYFDYDEKISYEEFLSAHPVFFWQDTFGRWIKFEGNRFIPQAECGKPVIYLYPETETHVSVKVSPKGGFSITIPEHGENGWNVIAQPNGELTEIVSGEKYPYLFWEGKGDIYESPKKGWVIEKNIADFFVAGKLRQFGFNSQEISDFLEFWSPRMQEGEEKYLFMSFWGTQYMNSIAPIEMNPQPDSILRVLMDYHEVENFYEVQAPKIKKFKREGFVMTEWGGTLWIK